jgi:hypothetical protein
MLSVSGGDVKKDGSVVAVLVVDSRIGRLWKILDGIAIISRAPMETENQSAIHYRDDKKLRLLSAGKLGFSLGHKRRGSYARLIEPCN